MNNTLYLSLCIPTNGLKHWVLPTLKHIYNQDCDTSLFEVIITDNGINSDLEEALLESNYPNLIYQKTTDVGFLNQISCFKLAKGKLIRMINHRSLLLPDTINKWIELIKKYEVERPIIYFSGGVLKKNFIECHNFESFVKEMSYFSSWSAGISFWNTDKDNLDKIHIDRMFPTTSILFEIRKESKYIIYNEKYQEMQDESGKGGYNLFETFAVGYLDILNNLRINNRISIKTFIQIKDDLYIFLKDWYYKLNFQKHNYTFDLTNIPMYMKVYYSKLEYLKMVIVCRIYHPFKTCKKILKRTVKFVNHR